MSINISNKEKIKCADPPPVNLDLIISLFAGCLPRWLGGKPTCQAGDPSLIPHWGESPGEGNCNPLQLSCLGNPMNRGSWQTTIMGSQRLANDFNDQTTTNHSVG